VDAYDRTQQNKLATGKVLALDNQIDTTTGTVKLRAAFNNKNAVLFPNQFVNTRLLVTTQHNMTLIPDYAIQHNGEVAFVYVIQNGIAHVRNVKPGTTNAGITAVEGINPGDIVATSSYEKLQDGSKVVISKTPLPQNTTESNAP
jgi:multidrug efflux system membrane fusion protein